MFGIVWQRSRGEKDFDHFLIDPELAAIRDAGTMDGFLKHQSKLLFLFSIYDHLPS